MRESRAGTLQLKLLLQSRNSAPLDADPLWPQERARLVSHLRQRLPLLRSLSMQVSLARARPSKDAPCAVLWGELCLLQSDPAYLVGPETFSQVNHHTGAALLSAVASWLRRPEVGLGPDDAVLVTGRDVNMFGTGVFSGTGARGSSACRPRPGQVAQDGNLDGNLDGRDGDGARCSGPAASAVPAAHAVPAAEPLPPGTRLECAHLTLVTHCPNAHADARRNLEGAARAAVCVRLAVAAGPGPDQPAAASGCVAVRVVLTLRRLLRGRALLVPKPETAPLLASLAALAAPPRLAIATAGRNGVGRAVCAELKRLPLRALVYVACCLDTATQDVAFLLSRGGSRLTTANPNPNPYPDPDPDPDPNPRTRTRTPGPGPEPEPEPEPEPRPKPEPEPEPGPGPEP